MNQLMSQENIASSIATDPGASAPELVACTQSEMLRLLEGVLEQAVPLTVVFPNSKVSLESSLIYIDQASHMLLLACPPQWQMALRAGADSVRLRCVYEDANLEFPGGNCVLVDLDNAPVVGVPIPDFMWRFQQRRRDPRHKVSGLSIVLNLGFLEAEAEVVDLSVGGVGLIHCNSDVKLDDGEVLQNCSITMPGVGQISVNLVIQHQRAVMVDGQSVTRAGCRFSGLADSSKQLIAHYLEAIANNRAAPQQ